MINDTQELALKSSGRAIASATDPLSIKSREEVATTKIHRTMLEPKAGT